MKLDVHDHDRGAAGMQYVYPVVSRRARGVSVGINLNPNNACNFRCIYCQVPNLVKGNGPPIDTQRLEEELARMLEDVLGGPFMERRVPEDVRRLNDIALSGNGEPTSSPHFREAIDIIGRALDRFHLKDAIKVVLITNGSLVHKPPVQQGLSAMRALNGEVWFKLDTATRQGAGRIHSVAFDPERQLARLRRASEICPTWIQSCLFAHGGTPPSIAERNAYLECLRALRRDTVRFRGVLLYTLARPSHQPEAAELTALPREWMQDFAGQVRGTGMPVELSL